MPSFPTAILAACLTGIAYSLVVPGRPRTWAKMAIAVLLALVAFARLYLGVDHPSDVVWAESPERPPRVLHTVKGQGGRRATGISRAKLYELMDDREIESVHIGRHRDVPADAVDAYIRRLR